jgi:hypothetical protein
MGKSSNENYSEQETVARREAALRRMLSTPHKPHSEMKLGAPRRKPSKSPGKRKIANKS